jgi:hypothetical protein
MVGVIIDMNGVRMVVRAGNMGLEGVSPAGKDRSIE